MNFPEYENALKKKREQDREFARMKARRESFEDKMKIIQIQFELQNIQMMGLMLSALNPNLYLPKEKKDVM